MRADPARTPLVLSPDASAPQQAAGAAPCARRSSQLQLVRRFGADSKNTSGVLDQVLKARVVTVALGGVLS